MSFPLKTYENQTPNFGSGDFFHLLLPPTGATLSWFLQKPFSSQSHNKKLVQEIRQTSSHVIVALTLSGKHQAKSSFKKEQSNMSVGDAFKQTSSSCTWTAGYRIFRWLSLPFLKNHVESKGPTPSTSPLPLSKKA